MNSFVVGGGGGGGGWSRKLVDLSFLLSFTNTGELHVAHAHRARITKEFYKNLFAPAPGLPVCAVVALVGLCLREHRSTVSFQLLSFHFHFSCCRCRCFLFCAYSILPVRCLPSFANHVHKNTRASMPASSLHTLHRRTCRFVLVHMRDGVRVWMHHVPNDEQAVVACGRVGGLQERDASRNRPDRQQVHRRDVYFHGSDERREGGRKLALSRTRAGARRRRRRPCTGAARVGDAHSSHAVLVREPRPVRLLDE